jgi:hypothetical protein
MAATKKGKSEEPTDPDSLVREAAGRYRSGDGRFQVQQSDSTWFLLDTQQTNELGQELIHGPFGALKAARDAIPGARHVKPLPRSRSRPAGRTTAKEPPPPPPPSWIDQLPSDEAAGVRRLIRALESEGLTGAEELVRSDRKGARPEVASRLIRRRLEALVADVPEEERKRALELIDRALEIATDDGDSVPKPMPRWALIEIGPEGDPPNRRIRIRG